MRVDSGTGNQLFQFAAGHALSLESGLALTLDPVAYAPFAARLKSSFDARDFVLCHLNLPAHIRNIPQGKLIDLRGYSRMRHLVLDGSRSRYHCPGAWTEAFDRVFGMKSILLTGYFQDVRYWGKHRTAVAELIRRSIHETVQRLDHPPPALPDNTAAMHIRGGDYLRTAGTNARDFTGYYHAAATRLLGLAGVEKLSVFTDDQAWAKDVLGQKFDDAITIESPDYRLGGLADLWRISTARAIAMACSTFSWWATRISAPETYVVAPSRWPDWCPSPDLQLLEDDWEILE